MRLQMGRNSINWNRTALILLSGFITLFILASYKVGWVHPESLIYFKNAGEPSPFGWLQRSLDFKQFDVGGWPRARFLSNLFFLIDADFRYLFAKYFVPHPSISVTWIFSLFAAPFLLFKVLLQRYQCKERAFLGVLFFLCSVGFLSTVSLRFHPGKPMALVGTLLVFWMAAKANTPWKRFTLCLLTYFLLFFDESLLFLLAAVPILYPNLFLTDKRPDLKFCFRLGVHFGLLCPLSRCVLPSSHQHPWLW